MIIIINDGANNEKSEMNGKDGNETDIRPTKTLPPLIQHLQLREKCTKDKRIIINRMIIIIDDSTNNKNRR